MSQLPSIPRTQRLQAIRDILRRTAVHNQAELCHELQRRGYPVTQSSVSRDLRFLPVGKVGGVYRLTDEGSSDEAVEVEGPPALEVGGAIREVRVAGPNLLVVKTVVGGASRVGLVIDRQVWPEVVGTVAGDDTLFIAVAGARERDRLRRRLESLVV